MASNKQVTSVQDWLDSLDLGHFAPNFLSNGLTELHLVCNLTETSLSLIGITQRGYQKRILNHLPTEAEAALSEFVSSMDSGEKGPDATLPPPMPPRRLPVREYGQENGHSTDKKPNFDDESYLHTSELASHVDITANPPPLAPRRSLPVNQIVSVPPGGSESAPLLPPRHPDRAVAPAPQSPSHQPSGRPMPQPRARADFGLSQESKPPPLPGRDERLERPLPRQRATPQIPPRNSQSQPVSAPSDPEPPQHPFAIQNDYEIDDSGGHLLTPPPILSDRDDLPAMPPPPPPKHSSVSTGHLDKDDGLFDMAPPPPPKHFPVAPSPARRSLPDIPNSELRSVPHPLPVQAISTAPQASKEGFPSYPQSVFLSPPPVLPFQSEACPRDSSNAISAPSSVPVIPPRPPPSAPGASSSDLPPPVLPPKDTGMHQRSFPVAGPNEDGVLSSKDHLPSPSIPFIPPRPPAAIELDQDQFASDMPPHILPPTERTLSGGREECAMPVLPPPSPPNSSTVPVIPQRPPSLPEPPPSVLPPPLPSPTETASHTDTPGLFKNKDNFDPFAFDPFVAPDADIHVYAVDPPLRPPSLFCNPEDNHTGVPSDLPSQSPQLPPAPSSSTSSSAAAVLVSRPVPVPPTPVIPSSQPAAPQDFIHNPLTSLPEESVELNDRIDEYLSQRSGKPLGTDFDQTRHQLAGDAVLNTQSVPVPRRDSGNPPALPLRSSVGSILEDPSAPTALPRKSSNLIDLAADDGLVTEHRTVPEGKESANWTDESVSGAGSEPTLSIDKQDVGDQYSKVYRSHKTASHPLPDVQEMSDAPELPARPPRIPQRLDPQGEAVPSIPPPERPTSLGPPAPPTGNNLSFYAPVSPSALSDGSDHHSYILLSESISGSHDDSEERIWPDDFHTAPLSSSTLNKMNDSTSSSSMEDAGAAFHTTQKPVRRAPPPPRTHVRSQAQAPQLPARPTPARREFIPSLTPIQKEDEYDLLNPKEMVYTSPLRDESSEGLDKFAFKELAQSEESCDDDESGFDTDSDESLAPNKPADLPVSLSLAERSNKIDPSHFLRFGQSYQSSVLRRAHSRSVDENTRKRLSKKLSQSLQDRNSTAEVPAKVPGLQKKGYLWKQGGTQNNKGFRKRWVEFDGRTMRYYENEKKLSDCKGIIPVGTMRDVKNLCGSSRLIFGDAKHINRITLETTGRSFHFGAETLDEGTLWANVLMQAILAYKPPPGGFPVGGDMTYPDKKGYVKIEGYHQKRFMAVKGEKLCIYMNELDFESAVVASEIPMKLASVKEMPKNKLQLATPGKIYLLTVDSPQEMREWMEAMKEAIQEGLSDHSILEELQRNPSNKYCADCRMKDPDWASINLAICICKNCSGLHRNLGVHMSKVRSLKMDTKVWTPALRQVMLDLGNDKSNAFWEANLNESEKAVPDDTLERRQVYILSKYKERKYCQTRTMDKNMDKNLVRAASLGNLDECFKLVFSGASVAYSREDGKTAIDVATECKFTAVVEFLNQNVGIQVLPPRNDMPSRVSPRISRQSGTPIVTPVSHAESKQEHVRKTGYLHKTGSNKKEFQKRYCTLEHGIFSYYEDKNQPAKNTIEGIDMVLIAVTDPKPGHKFCFEIFTSFGRTYLMSAETEEERKEWMIALAKIHSLECMWDCLKDFVQAGFLHKKEGAAATNWQRLWFILKGKSLVSFSSSSDELEEIDLRKLITLSRQESDSVGATDYSHTLSIVLPGKNIYLRAETKQAADCWYENINKITLQAGTALEDQPLTAENVPIFVSQCINFVARHEGIMTEGIYRLSGTSSVIRKITAAFTEDPRNARLKEEYSVHDVTGALKKFFRELPNPLLTTKLYQKWTEVGSYKDHSIRLQWYQHLLSELPPVNYHTLKMLIGHLKNVADFSDFNKMYIRNLAAVFGPTLMASDDSSFVHAEHEIAVIADLLTYYAWLYGVTDEQMAKEREKELKYQEGLSKIRAAQASENSAEQLILMEIFQGKKGEGNSINIKISMDHTAAEITKMAQDQLKIIDDGSWALFEVIAKGELERIIHDYERVLPQVLAWNQQMRADNYICIKENLLLEKIQPFMEQATLSDQVKFSESKKSFKKYNFELMNNVVTCYKDKNSTPFNSWKVADMKIYVGIERKRSPPTQWGISFMINNEDGMKAMCLDNEASYLFWLAGLLKSKRDAPNNMSGNSVVDPASLTYSTHALSFKSEHESSFARYSRNLPKELSNITSKMSFWRKSRLNSMDES